MEMTKGVEPIEVESIALEEVAEALRQSKVFAETSVDKLMSLPQVDRVTVKGGTTVVEANEKALHYWLVLEGALRAERPEPDGTRADIGWAGPGEGFGEIPLLMGKRESSYSVRAEADSVLLRFSEDGFWALMACCPKVRSVVLSNVAQRIQSHQVEALHREKLVSLGTLAAGLMHELHNPGSAAKREAALLRENLLKLQQLSLKFSDKPKSTEELNCIRGLLEHTLNGCHAPAMSTMEQSDAEERMSEWLAEARVENAYTIGPALVGIGFSEHELRCAKEAFEPEAFSYTLNWLEALVSSVSHVCAIEESISRISDLAMAVKKFAYDGRSALKTIDVHDSLQSTLTILGHKLRIKQISVIKYFDASPSTIETRGSALAQVWTNLIDNAADASPTNEQIEIATWSEPEWLAVSITDHGPGIAAEVLPHIFEPFFTTKPQGSGTGLGLEIVHRIVTQKFGGKIDIDSAPGRTRFIVRLPNNGTLQCSIGGPEPSKN